MIDWVRAEIETFAWLLERRKHIWIIPFVFFLFCMFMKLLMSINYDNYIFQQVNSPFSPFVSMVYEKGFNKINKIAVFGSLSIFILMYRKARKNY